MERPQAPHPAKPGATLTRPEGVKGGPRRIQADTFKDVPNEEILAALQLRIHSAACRSGRRCGGGTGLFCAGSTKPHQALTSVLFSRVFASRAWRAPPKIASVSHLAFGPIVDRLLDRLHRRVAARCTRVGQGFLSHATKVPRLLQRGRQPRFLSVGIVPGRVLGHGAMRAIGGAACNIATAWGSTAASYCASWMWTKS